ncbi:MULTISPECIES: hypothetical protein [unclassified Arthrobacter]|uniref:hypothetical protein n=1 Tax=unclassified Arthrobacter TaxID=235627 RepID=UPI001F26A04C|nr:hypothetical protein [Arthrobacter sp. FW305-BF8]UKA56151.1 hypothetical protein LFT45_09680 [Arthrobacter sp. FW305-BF8]
MNYRVKTMHENPQFKPLVLCIAILALSGCAAESAADKSRATQEVDAAMEKLGDGLTPDQKADGFVYVGDGVAVRWAKASEKSGTTCPSYAESCYKVAIQTNLACVSGIYIELQLKNDAGTIIGKANEITPGMRADDKGVFAVSTAIEAPQASMADVHCMG